MPEPNFPVELVDGVPVVSAPEEIDITNAAGLRAALLQAAAPGTRTLVVDMSRTQFCDSAALNVLVRAHKRAQAEGREVLLVIADVTVLRLKEALAQALAVFGSPPLPAAAPAGRTLPVGPGIL